MDVTEAIETRIELREYADEPVDAETKEAVLDAGRLASSGRNLQHWRFVLVDDADDLDRLGEASPTVGWIAGADFAVAVCTDPSYDFHEIDAGRARTCSSRRGSAGSARASTPRRPGGSTTCLACPTTTRSR